MNKKLELAKEIKKAFKEKDLFHFESYYEHHTPEGCSIARLPEHHVKNKGNHWGFPFDHNLVTSIPNYINASPMEFNSVLYIAAQGPRASTFTDFWHMVWEENIPVIVTLTNEMEVWQGSLQMKFERYWPDTEPHPYGPFILTCLEDEELKSWNDGRGEKLRKKVFRLSCEGKERQIIHLHMENWPDAGIIHPGSLIELADYVDECIPSFNSKMVVHCAAGVGRTGTFIAYHSLSRELPHLEREEVINTIVERVKEMRQLRWGAMVSHTLQYKLLLDALYLKMCPPLE